jgi:hypothetical protein
VTSCTVSYRDLSGIEHAVEVTADSLYEAATLGVEALASAELPDSRPGPVLEVTVNPPPVKHRVGINQLREWIESGSKSPREVILKQPAEGAPGALASGSGKRREVLVPCFSRPLGFFPFLFSRGLPSLHR